MDDDLDTIVVGYVGVAIVADDGRLTGEDITEVDWHAGVDDSIAVVTLSEMRKRRAAAVTERSWRWVLSVHDQMSLMP